MSLLCSGIADWCRKNGVVSEEEYPIVLYGIQVLLNTSLKVLGILLIGAILHRLAAVCISMAVFCSMRYWTGGWHSKSHLGCFCTIVGMGTNSSVSKAIDRNLSNAARRLGNFLLNIRFISSTFCSQINPWLG